MYNQLQFLSGGDDHGLAGLLAYAAISVRHAGIEIDGVSGVEFVVVHADAQAELALHDMQELGAGMLVRAWSFSSAMGSNSARYALVRRSLDLKSRLSK